MSTVSAIILNNDSKYELKKAIGSVFAQTKNADEIIIIDNSFDDGIGAYVQSMDRTDVRYYRIDGSAEHTDCELRDIGIKKAGGGYIAFLNSRDIWHERHLERMLEEDEDADIIISGYKQQVCVSLRKWSGEKFSDMNPCSAGILQYLYAPSASLIKKEFATGFENIANDETKVRIVPDILSTHWSNAMAFPEKMERAFWERYGEIVDKRGMHAEAELYMSILFHQD
ncbi:MAG: glycosyltransferase family 2 protein [Lachnospiraceae bacterium]|nr:glycosyltransferase family 2 protein [Lachnospiraceae bacterium]